MTTSPRVFLVEDNPADVYLLREAFRETGFTGEITVADDGSKALDFVRRFDLDQNAPPVDLIILDLNLPKLGGLTVLTEIRRKSHLDRIPVIVLSTSPAARDNLAARELGADRYLSKAFDFRGTVRLAREIETIWRASRARR